LRYFTNLVKRYYSQVGIGAVANKKIGNQYERLVPPGCLAIAFEDIVRQIGDKVLYNIGYSVPQNVQFLTPPPKNGLWTSIP
jgi:hypothetical protein